MYPKDNYSTPTGTLVAPEKEDASLPHEASLPHHVPPPTQDANGKAASAGLFNIAVRFTIVTTLLLGVGYPLLVTGLAQLTMRDKANGQLLTRNGDIVGSKLIGQAFTSDMYFHGRPSAAGNGYDATSSGGSNLGPTNKKLIDRISSDVASNQKQNPGQDVPIDLVTTSGSGLDPDITPASAFYQVARIAQARHLPEQTVRALVQSHIEGRQFGVLGEPTVNVLQLNLELDGLSKTH